MYFFIYLPIAFHVSIQYKQQKTDTNYTRKNHVVIKQIVSVFFSSRLKAVKSGSADVTNALRNRYM